MSLAALDLDPISATAAHPALGPARFLYLDQDDMVAAGVLDMPCAMAAVRTALVDWAQGRGRQPHKLVLRADDDPACEADWRINGLCAALGSPVRSLGMKWIASFPPNRLRGLPRASGMLVLNSPDSGLPIALMDATLLSAMRTGAVTALGLQHLAPRKPRRAVVIGAGVQARTQVLALLTACPTLDHISILSRDRGHAARCARDCRREWNIPGDIPLEAIAAAGPERAEVLAAADIAITATSAAHPVLFAGEIPDAALIVQIAGHECAFELVEACDTIVCDDWDTIRHRGIPTLARMHAAGRLTADRIHANLPQVLTGERSGRTRPGERIHFAHIGLGLEDVALGAAVLASARELDCGRWLTLWRRPRWV